MPNPNAPEEGDTPIAQSITEPLYPAPEVRPQRIHLHEAVFRPPWLIAKPVNDAIDKTSGPILYVEGAALHGERALKPVLCNLRKVVEQAAVVVDEAEDGIEALCCLCIEGGRRYCFLACSRCR